MPIPNQQTAENAQRGLDLRAKQPDSNKCCTDVGIARARQLSNRENVSTDTLKRMISYFERHEVDKQGEGWGKDSKGYQAWLMWGGDAGWAWAKSELSKIEMSKSEAFKIPMFTHGQWNGKAFTRQDLERAAIAYDPTQRPASIIETHKGAEKLGTIYRFELSGDWLTAFSKDLTDKGKALLEKSGLRSIGFLPVGHPENPTDSLLLDHVALGVNNPAVAGIPDAELVTFSSDTSEDTPSMENNNTEARLAALEKRLSEFMKSTEEYMKKGKREKTEKTEMEQKLESKLQAANTQVAQTFAQSMVDANKVHPKQKELLAFAAAQLIDTEAKLEFDKRQLSPFDALQDVFSKLPAVETETQAEPEPQKEKAEFEKDDFADFLENRLKVVGA